MIIVPPTLSANNMAADQKETKPSENPLDPIIKTAIKAIIPVMARMVYLYVQIRKSMQMCGGLESIE